MSGKQSKKIRKTRKISKKAVAGAAAAVLCAAPLAAEGGDFLVSLYPHFSFPVIKFDDSIIEDKEAESNRALRELSAGVLSKVEYREKIFGETPELAEKEIQKIKEEDPNTDDLLGTRGEE